MALKHVQREVFAFMSVSRPGAWYGSFFDAEGFDGSVPGHFAEKFVSRGGRSNPCAVPLNRAALFPTRLRYGSRERRSSVQLQFSLV